MAGGAEVIVQGIPLRRTNGRLAPDHRAAFGVRAAGLSYGNYGAYFRRVRDSLSAAVASEETSHIYPDRCEHCDICTGKLLSPARRRAKTGVLRKAHLVYGPILYPPARRAA
jgi:hypothetical protein